MCTARHIEQVKENFAPIFVRVVFYSVNDADQQAGMHTAVAL
jgi:hypothetical protein